MRFWNVTFHSMTGDFSFLRPRPLGILLRNIILGRRPLYGIQEWVEPYAPALLELQPNPATGWGVLSTNFSTPTAVLKTRIAFSGLI